MANPLVKLAAYAAVLAAAFGVGAGLGAVAGPIDLGTGDRLEAPLDHGSDEHGFHGEGGP